LLGYDPYVEKIFGEAYTLKLVDVDYLCQNSDAICLHAPLTEESFHLIDSNRISLLKKHSIIVNAGRSPVVDEDSLYLALKNQEISTYVTDVFPVEPPDLSKPIYKLDNVIATHHIGAMTETAVVGMQVTAISNIKAVLQGDTPSNFVI
jgi:D-3-phosphoglycerate dehydrogenase